MFVDDNFIGNRRAVRALLPELARWRHTTGAPFDFFTEASIDLADHPELVDAMVAGGFAVVFIGIESPSEASLRETRKLQNLGRDVVEQVRGLRERGLDVWGGFILGFDNDGPEIFDRMIDLVQRSGIAYAMVGMLTALPNTGLYKRLEREGRLHPDEETGDMFRLSNIVMKLPVDTMVEGYVRVLQTLYDPQTYFDRCREHLAHWRCPPQLGRPTSLEDLRVLWRSIRTQGLTGGYRRSYWLFLAWVVAHHPGKLALAVAQACAGHHFITYTRETAVPSLRQSLRTVARSEENPSPRRVAQGA